MHAPRKMIITSLVAGRHQMPPCVSVSSLEKKTAMRYLRSESEASVTRAAMSFQSRLSVLLGA